MFSIGVEQTPDHALILRVVLPRLTFEEVDAALAQRDRHLDPLVPKNEILGWR